MSSSFQPVIVPLIMHDIHPVDENPVIAQYGEE